MVVATAAPASAHHNTIDAYVTCTDDFKFQINWTVTNSETLTEEITASNRPSVVPIGTTLGNKETKTFTE
ncbi:MAG: hypothetical protein ABL886_15355, partial [Rhodoglobus sp.]